MARTMQSSLLAMGIQCCHSGFREALQALQGPCRVKVTYTCADGPSRMHFTQKPVAESVKLQATERRTSPTRRTSLVLAGGAAETASLEEHFQGWGEVVLLADRVLRWEKPWFPAALMGAVSFVFLMIYYLDPSVLSGVSCFVMCFCLADYLVPALAPRIFGSNQWTTEQQQRLHEICSNLVKTRRRIIGWWKRLFVLKEEKPKMYFMSMISALAVVAWIGQQVHNLFLTYLIVSFVLLVPGLNKHGIITKFLGMGKREINKLIKQKEKKNE